MTKRIFFAAGLALSRKPIWPSIELSPWEAGPVLPVLTQTLARGPGASPEVGQETLPKTSACRMPPK
jgi:hypothetical protein